MLNFWLIFPKQRGILARLAARTHCHNGFGVRPCREGCSALWILACHRVAAPDLVKGPISEQASRAAFLRILPLTPSKRTQWRTTSPVWPRLGIVHSCRFCPRIPDARHAILSYGSVIRFTIYSNGLNRVSTLKPFGFPDPTFQPARLALDGDERDGAPHGLRKTRSGRN